MLESSVLRPAWVSSDEGGQFEAYNHQHGRTIRKNFYKNTQDVDKMAENIPLLP